MMAQLELKNDVVVDIDTQLTAHTLITLQDEGVVDKDFIDRMLNAGVEDEIPLRVKLNAVYAAYREANKVNYLDYDTFMMEYQIDLIKVNTICAAAVLGKDVAKFSHYANSLVKKIPKEGSMGK
ncbi:hypothetical protein [Listeria booriae]|nr:hypothetical protein [Listeria booriae]